MATGWFGGSCGCSCFGPVVNCETTNPLSTILRNDAFNNDCLDDDATHGYFGIDGPCGGGSLAGTDQSGDDLVDCYEGVRVASIGDTSVGAIIDMVLGPHKYKMSVANGTLEAGTLDASGSVKMGHERLINTTDSQAHVSLGQYQAPEEYRMTVEICGILIECKSVRTGTFNSQSTFYTTTLKIGAATSVFTTALSHYKDSMPTMSWSIEQTAAAYKDGSDDVADFTISVTGGGGSTFTKTDETFDIEWCNHDNYMEVEIEGAHSTIGPSEPDLASPAEGVSLTDARSGSITSMSHRLCFPMIDDFEFEVVET